MGPAPAASTHAGGLVAVVGLGDYVDGYLGASDGAARSEADLARLVVPQFARLAAAGAPVRPALGNHDLAVPRPRLVRALGLPEGSRGWYSAPLAPGWRLVVLDTTDISVYGAPKVRGQGGAQVVALTNGPVQGLGRLWQRHRHALPHAHTPPRPAPPAPQPQGSAEAAAASAQLAALAASGAPNALDWNSGVGRKQLDWLRVELAGARRARERVVVAAHHPLVVGSAPAHYLAWNAGEILAAFDAHPGVVALVVSSRGGRGRSLSPSSSRRRAHTGAPRLSVPPLALPPECAPTEQPHPTAPVPLCSS
jgi:hypothetical protein